MGPAGSTSGYVKLLLPPRQSRGNSNYGVSIPRQSRGLYFKSRSKRLFGVADAAPVEVSRSKRLSGPLTRPRLVWAT
jgi:hypothetical protein